MITSLKKCGTIAAALLALSGCAAPNGDRAIASGNLDLAEREARAAAQGGDATGYTNLGVIAHKRGNVAQAVELFTIAARMGEPTARMNLANWGQTVPAADLAAPQAGPYPVQLGPSAFVSLAGSVPLGKPLPVIPPLGAKTCTPRAIVEGGVTRWVQVCQ